MGCVEVGDANEFGLAPVDREVWFVEIVHRTITVDMFSRERVILNVEPNAILWLKRVVLYGPIGLTPAKFTDALTLGAVCVRQSLPIKL